MKIIKACAVIGLAISSLSIAACGGEMPAEGEEVGEASQALRNCPDGFCEGGDLPEFNAYNGPVGGHLNYYGETTQCMKISISSPPSCPYPTRPVKNYYNRWVCVN